VDSDAATGLVPGLAVAVAVAGVGAPACAEAAARVRVGAGCSGSAPFAGAGSIQSTVVPSEYLCTAGVLVEALGSPNGP
jgi:hypothetical protein